MMLSTALMTLTKMIYSQLFKSVMRDKDCFIINVIIKRFFLYSIQKSISFIFHVFDN